MHEVRPPENAFPMYVITGPNTSDFPGQYTVRRHWIGGGLIYVEIEAWGHKPTLEEARSLVPAGKTRLDRAPGDDPVIVESWV